MLRYTRIFLFLSLSFVQSRTFPFYKTFLFQLNVFGHQYIAQQYYTVIGCNNCHQIIFGISPQGYQCSGRNFNKNCSVIKVLTIPFIFLVCHINLHRHCVKLYDDSCPGPIIKKDRGIRKFIGMKDSTDHSRIKKTSHFLQSKFIRGCLSRVVLMNLMFYL